MAKEIVVIGSGISGLSAAFRLSKLFPHDTVTVLEKESRSGGWIQSQEKEGFFFEMGPRVFKGSKSPSLLALIDELGLNEKVIISANPKRYIVEAGSLRSLPSGPLSFVFSSYFFPVAFSLIRETWIKRSEAKDESIADFISRRFGRYVLEKLFDPLVQGIYAADPKELSISTCFSNLKRLEQTYGSVVKGLCKEMCTPSRERKKNDISGRLFSLEGGVEKLVDAIKEQGSFSIEYRHNVLGVTKEEGRYVIETDRRRLKADAVFIATGAKTASCILSSNAHYASHLLGSIHSTSITSVSIGFHSKVLQKRGFGYLVPTAERLAILGCVMDSEVFDDSKEQTRLTLMLKGAGYSEQKIQEHTNYALKRHMRIEKKPDYMRIAVARECIPKLAVGHNDLIGRLQNEMEKTMPGCFLIGSYVKGVSVSDCIDTAMCAAERFKDSIG